MTNRIYSRLSICLALFSLASLASGAEVLRLDFENGANLAEDTSGNGLVGTISNSSGFSNGTLTQSTDVRPGSLGTGSANFDDGTFGFDDGKYIDFSTIPAFTVEDSFTVSVWLKPTAAFIADTTGLRGILSGLSVASPNRDWQVDNGSSTTGGAPGTDTVSRLATDGGPDLDLNASGDLSDTAWQQVVFSYHAPSRNAVVYLDGVLSASSDNEGFAMESFLVGINRGLVRVYEGLMDELVLLDTPSVLDGTGVLRMPGDLDFDGDLDADDWNDFKAGQTADLSSLSTIDAYRLGDVDFDGDNDFDDFNDFKRLFNDVHGPSAFESLLAVPEPGALLLMLSGLMASLGVRPRRRLQHARQCCAAAPIESVSRTRIWKCFAVGCTLVASWTTIDGNLNAQTTVFSADFESGLVEATVGTLTVSNSTASVLPTNYTTNPQTHTDWGTNALLTDRIADNINDPGSQLDWSFTDPVSLVGSTVNFEYMSRRAGSGPQKSTTITGYDSSDAELFTILLIARENYSTPDYLVPGDDQERQERGVGYVDPVEGNSLFTVAQIASGMIPDTNDDGSNGGEVGFYGNNPPSEGEIVEADDAAVFSIGLTATGWTLSGIASPTPDANPTGLSDFTTTVIPYSDAGVTDLFRIEANVATDQGGGYWDNLSVTGTVVDLPDPLKLQVAANGDMTLSNVGGDTSYDIDYIEILSPDAEEDGGSLNPAGFTGIGGDPGYPAGDDSGNGWELAEPNTVNELVESFLIGDSTFGVGDSAALGSGFVPGSTQDLVFRYHVVGDDVLQTGVVEYLGAAGDADGDGDVDGADFLLLQRTNPGGIAEWAANYPSAGSVSAVSGVPEPAALSLFGVAAMGVMCLRRRATPA